MSRLNFEEIEVAIETMGTSAQATLMFRLIQKLGPGVTRSVLRYCHAHLDQINTELNTKRNANDRADKVYRKTPASWLYSDRTDGSTTDAGLAY